MSTADFFMENFGRHFIEPTGDNWADVGNVLRGSYPMTGKSSLSRMQSGWAIVRPGSATLQLDLAVPGVQKSRMTRFEAFAAELAAWDGIEPRIFMLFDKAPISAKDIFVSVDKRRVRICTNAGAKTEDWTVKPPVVKGVKK
ncbi:MAG: hypothetical protein WCO22_06715 [Betaproteobacteria bacterium]